MREVMVSQIKRQKRSFDILGPTACLSKSKNTIPLLCCCQIIYLNHEY